jgi:hypothetical protein
MALFAVNWNKSKAPVALHRSRMTLYRKVAKYHIEHGAAQGGGLASILHDANKRSPCAGLLQHHSTVIDPSYAVGVFDTSWRPSST